MKKIISIVLVVLWMGLIFFLSSMNGVKSTSASKGIIFKSVKIVNQTLYKVKIVSKPLTDLEIKKITKKLNYPVRKGMHMFSYFVLTILIFNALYQFKVKKIYLTSILMEIIYASSDEFHQLFTGRTGTIIDVFIDTSGGLIALLILYKLFNKKVIKNI